MKNILITGSAGFIGKNLSVRLEEIESYNILKIDENDPKEKLEEYLIKADLIFHLAGVNRPTYSSDFNKVNLGFTTEVLQFLKKNKLKPKIVFSSSTQAELENEYGISKKLAEDELIKFGKETGSRIRIYRFTNVFGKWSKPNYNSVVSTFCYNIANNIPIEIHDPSKILKLIYIDDIVESLIEQIENESIEIFNKFDKINPVFEISLGNLAEIIQSFKESRKNLRLPDVSDLFTKNLYSTYLTYLNEDDFCYKLTSHTDNRGNLTELIKSPNFGQIFISNSYEGIIRGNHYHHTKVEKFIVIKGEAEINFRKIDSDEIHTYRVSGADIEVVDIPPGYTHNIKNIGEKELTVLFWANEIFDPEKPDTKFLEV